MKIMLGAPCYDDHELRRVAAVLRSGWLTQGSRVEELERDFAKYIGVGDAIAVFNGTCALHTALSALGVGPGDEILVPSFTFIATANAVLYQNARPVFVDIDPQTLNINPEDMELKITKRTKGVIPVHYGGLPAEMDTVNQIAEKHGLFVLEDAAEAIGAVYKGKKVGSLGAATIFSLHAQKVITTGEGGIITTDNEKLAEACRRIRDHGRDAQTKQFVCLGYNYRMTEMQAALGVEQLKKIETIIQKRIANANYLAKRLIQDHNLVLPQVSPHLRHTFMLYTIRVNSGRDALMEYLHKQGVEAKVYFHPIHLEPFYKTTFDLSEGLLPVTEKVSRQVLSLPVHAKLTQEELDYIADNTLHFLSLERSRNLEGNR
jgi:perosamine synthetase